MGTKKKNRLLMRTAILLVMIGAIAFTIYNGVTK